MTHSLSIQEMRNRCEYNEELANDYGGAGTPAYVSVRTTEMRALLDRLEEQERLLESLDALISKHQLEAANSNLRPDIKQGHWIACANIRDELRKSQGKVE